MRDELIKVRRRTEPQKHGRSLTVTGAVLGRGVGEPGAGVSEATSSEGCGVGAGAGVVTGGVVDWTGGADVVAIGSVVVVMGRGVGGVTGSGVTGAGVIGTGVGAVGGGWTGVGAGVSSIGPGVVTGRGVGGVVTGAGVTGGGIVVVTGGAVVAVGCWTGVGVVGLGVTASFTGPGAGDGGVAGAVVGCVLCPCRFLKGTVRGGERGNNKQEGGGGGGIRCGSARRDMALTQPPSMWVAFLVGNDAGVCGFNQAKHQARHCELPRQSPI